MIKKMTLLFTLCTTFLLFTSLSTVKADNGIPYYTFTEDSEHQLTYTQDAYIPVTVLDQLNGYGLLRPEDLYIDKFNTMYIADTGHGAIVVVEENSNEVYTIGKGTLATPKGVFVSYEDDEPMIYAADYTKLMVFKFDKEGNLLQTFSKPDHPLFGKDSSFKPTKVTVDNRGNVYIVDPANLNGIIQLSKYGEFVGYFGSNYSKPDLRRIIQYMFSTKEQKKKLRLATLSPANLVLNNDGLISAISNDVPNGIVQSFNVSGDNNLGYARTDFTALINQSTTDPILMDITIGPIGNIYVVNSLGFIAEYDIEGNLLFVFGGKDQSGYEKGLTNTPSAIAVDKNYNLYVLDTADNKIHVYAPTEFANLVHEALNYYQEGFYLKSQEPWQEVLERNSLFDLAHKGLGKAYFIQQMYHESLDEFEMANDKVGYSESYWEIRNQWFEDNLKYIIVLLFILVIDFLIIQSYLVKSLIRLIKKPFHLLDKYKLYQQLTYITYFIKNPADGYYGIKREHKVSILSASLFYLILYFEHLFSKVYTGFIFNYTNINQLSLVQEGSKIIGILFLFVISNYLVSSINDGEGKLKDVYKATIYSFVPLIFYWPIIVVLSNFLTLNEVFIYQTANRILWGWSFVLLFIMIKEVHNYNFKETIKNIIITLFTMFMIVASLFIFYVLIQQVITFFFEVILEVRSNA